MCPPRDAQEDGNAFQDLGLTVSDKKPVACTCYTGSNLEAIFENKALNNVNYLYIILEIILVGGI